jgi:hypothetical protein
MCDETIRNKGQQIECCDTEAQNKNLLIPPSKTTERAAKCCKAVKTL